MLVSLARTSLLAAAVVGALRGQAEHWSFEPVAPSVALPPVGDAAWCRNGIDRFVLARLRGTGCEVLCREQQSKL